MKQYKITTNNISKDSEDDCVLDVNDPVNEIKRMQYLGGIGYKPYIPEGSNISYGETFGQAGLEKSEIMKKNNIRPGDPEWFRLWFSRPYWIPETMKGNNK